MKLKCCFVKNVRPSRGWSVYVHWTLINRSITTELLLRQRHFGRCATLKIAPNQLADIESNVASEMQFAANNGRCMCGTLCNCVRHGLQATASWRSKRQGNMTVYRKSLLAGLGFAVAVAMLFAYYLFASYQQERKLAQARVANASLLVSEWTRGAFAQSDLVLRDIASAVPLSEVVFPTLDAAQHKRRNTLLEAKRQTVPFAFHVGLFDERCTITHLPPVPERVGFDASQFEHCTGLRNQDQRESLVTHAFKAKIGGKLNVTQARRLETGGPGFHGYAAFAIELGFFAQWLNRIDLGPHGYLAVIDTAGMLVASRPSSTNLGQTVTWVPVSDFAANADAHVVTRDATVADGVARLTSIRRVEGLPFIVMAGEADQDWLANWWMRVWGSLVIVLGFWAMTFMTVRHYWTIVRHDEELVTLANTDALTGVPNRRSFIADAEREIHRVQRHGRQMALMLLDIDRFKSINDTHGHAVGDQAIVACARTCQALLRKGDLICRLGGDEFAILLVETDEAGAASVAERILAQVRSIDLRGKSGEPVPMSCSIGVAMLDQQVPNADIALALADDALYQSKHNGRNRHTFARPVHHWYPGSGE